MTNKELFEALRMFEKEKDIPMDYMLMQIEKAITIACKNYFDGNEDVIFKADPEKNSFDVKLKKTVVDEVFDPSYEVSLEEAAQINKRKKFEIGDEIEVPLDPKKLGRIAISAARNVIRQGIRAGEKGQSLLEFQSKLGEIVTATVERNRQERGYAPQERADRLREPQRGRPRQGLHRRREGQRKGSSRYYFEKSPGLCQKAL